MTHEEILKKITGLDSRFILALSGSDALKAMEEATEFWIKQWNFAQQQLSEKDKEIASLKSELEEIREGNAKASITYGEWAAEKNKEISELKEAAKELLHLHMCEQEGLSSGKPTIMQWCEAVDKLSKLIY